MRIASVLFASLVLGAWLPASTAFAQADTGRVDIILSNLPPRGSPAYTALQKAAVKPITQPLRLTKCEKWSVRKEHVAALLRAAQTHATVVKQLGADWNHVLQAPATTVAITEQQKSMVDLAQASTATTKVTMAATPPPAAVENALTAGPSGKRASHESPKITLKLSDATTLTLTRTSYELRPGMCIWRGTVDGTGAPASIMWWAGGKMAGMIQHEGRIYSIRHMGGDMHAIVEMAEDRMPQEHAPMPTRIRVNDPSLRDDPLVHQGDASILRSFVTGMRAPASKPVQAQPETMRSQKQPAPSSKDVVIDVIVAYTAKAARHYADIRSELVELSIEESNHSFRMSHLGHVKLRLVHAYQTDYAEEEAAHFDHVWRLADKGDGYMEEIHALRDKHRADVAVLIVDDPKGCGLATRVYADADEAFAVVHHECAAASYTVAHEIGHLIGARHDLGLDRSMTPFPYGHGYVNGTKWRDIMSYKESCAGCPRLPVWSSPKVMVKGEPAGTPDLDNARVIAEQAARVAAFR